MNRKKVRKLLDSIADQLTSEVDGLILTLQELKAEHEERIKKDSLALESGNRPEGRIANIGWHHIQIKKINKAIRQVQN